MAKTSSQRKKIIVAPLNWGLGHASRCILIIQLLLKNNYQPVIASDGDALKFLQKEFPNEEFLELPSYGITYSKKGVFLKWKLLFSFFRIRKVVRQESLVVENYLQNNSVVAILSDNRFGVLNTTVPSVYITHQLKVFSGIFTPITSFFHKRIIQRFDECWIPDKLSTLQLSGKLSEGGIDIPKRFIGNLSRFEKQEKIKHYDFLVLLSGPEPQRTLLEEKIITEFQNFEGKVLLVRGGFNLPSLVVENSSIVVEDYLLTEKLQEALHNAKYVLSRSGYSTLMDLEKLNAKAIFIPTPGQGEQHYLAKHLQSLQIAPYFHQKTFRLSNFNEIKNYSGFTTSAKNDELEKVLFGFLKN